MPKRLVPSCGRSPRRTRQTRLVLPHPPSNRVLPTTPNVAFTQTLFPSNPKLKTYKVFLNEKLLARPGFNKTPEVVNEIYGEWDHDCYIEDEDCSTKIDVFKEWSSLLKDAVSI